MAWVDGVRTAIYACSCREWECAHPILLYKPRPCGLCGEQVKFVRETDEDTAEWEYDEYAEWSGLRESFNIREARAVTDADYEGTEEVELD